MVELSPSSPPSTRHSPGKLREASRVGRAIERSKQVSVHRDPFKLRIPKCQRVPMEKSRPLTGSVDENLSPRHDEVNDEMSPPLTPVTVTLAYVSMINRLGLRIGCLFFCHTIGGHSWSQFGLANLLLTDGICSKQHPFFGMNLCIPDRGRRASI